MATVTLSTFSGFSETGTEAWASALAGSVSFGPASSRGGNAYASLVDGSEIPLGATINSVTIEVDWATVVTTGVFGGYDRIFIGTSLAGVDNAVAPSPAAEATAGGATTTSTSGTSSRVVLAGAVRADLYTVQFMLHWESSGGFGSNVTGTAALSGYRVIVDYTPPPAPGVSAPPVDCGPDQYAQGPLNSTVHFDATVTPAAGFTITGYAWTMLSGPGPTPTISTPTTEDTDVVFDTYVPGTYVFQLEVTGTVSGDPFPSIFGTVNGIIPLPQAPRVSSSSVLVTYPATAIVTPTVVDDGWNGSVTYLWSQLIGPGTAVFTDPTTLTAEITFPNTPGSYVFQLLASNAALSGTGMVRVFVFTSATSGDPEDLDDVVLTVNGVTFAPAQINSTRIDESVGGRAGTCSFTVQGVLVPLGADVLVERGSTRYFSGVQLTASSRYVEGQLFSDVSLAGPEWRMALTRVTGIYTNQSATAIALAMIAMAPEFASTNVQAGLPTIDLFVVDDLSLPEALDLLVSRLENSGAFVGSRAYAPAGYVMLSTAAAALNLTGTVNTGSYGTAVLRGWAAFRAGVFVPLRANVLWTDEQFATADVAISLEFAAGAAAFSNPSWRVDYFNVVSLGYINTSATDPVPLTTSLTSTFTDLQIQLDMSKTVTRVIFIGGGSNVSSKTAIGATSLFIDSIDNFNVLGGKAQVNGQSIDYTGADIFKEGLFSLGGDKGFDLLIPAVDGSGAMANGTYTYYATAVDLKGQETSVLGSQSVLISGGNNSVQLEGSGATVDHSPLILGYKIYRSKADTPLPAYFLVQVGPITPPTIYSGLVYNDISADASLGAAADLTVNHTIVLRPRLRGVTGIVAKIPIGDAVNVRIQLDDTAAQTALARLLDPTGSLGRDGIVSIKLTGSTGYAESFAAALSYLRQQAKVVKTVSYRTRDKNSHPSATATFNFPYLVGDMLIQSVSIQGFEKGVSPDFSVTASSSPRIAANAVIKRLG